MAQAESTYETDQWIDSIQTAIPQCHLPPWAVQKEEAAKKAGETWKAKAAAKAAKKVVRAGAVGVGASC